ncbi:TlpA disulfide reductase family protein [Agrobacterium tumefaciens]|uniref:TlpA disulfide reductase family protein n=1 Tax=Agrobacterium tumefaciens TaxID=358 RepID=UPI0021D3397C|nr:TlpA disulfide reductase family protein [Agrobacterium tumefaciens]UXS05406.1 TlpA family protein disulfide reductase [Agrobacterium tumefaciens]
MNAVSIGPLVFSNDRFAALVAGVVFFVACNVVVRRVDARFGPWGWKAFLIFGICARLGHVLVNADAFASEPLRVFSISQGGFHLSVGAVGVLAYTAFYFRRDLSNAAWTLIPGALSAFAAMLVVALAEGTPPIGLPAANFSNLQGERVNPSTFQGKPIVINLWASWCAPCRREMPMMAEVADGNEKATFLFVNQGEGRTEIDRYLNHENILLEHVLLDPLGQFSRNYKVPGLPATLFVGGDGTLQSVHMGEISREALILDIKNLQDAGGPED